MLKVRAAKPEDLPAVYRCIEENANLHNAAHEFVATLEDLRRALFNSQPRAYCDIAEVDGAAAGASIWYYNFSTFAGRAGIHLEDLVVYPEHRRAGVGGALMARLMDRCIVEELQNLEWMVLDANVGARNFYSSMGGSPQGAWTLWKAGRLRDAAALRYVAARA